MTVEGILAAKGTEVVTIAPEQTLGDVARLLTERGIGAVVVTRGGGNVLGIISERDIVRAIAARGAAGLTE